MAGIALVTGANRGIGLEVCRQMAQQGFTMLMGSRDAAKGEAAAAALLRDGLAVRVLHLDVADPASIEAARAQVEADYGRPVRDGAAGIVWAATLPDSGPTGGFFRDGKPLKWLVG